MQERIDVSPAELRAHVSPVSERFAATTVGTATLVFDEDDPDRWILSDICYDRDDAR